ncbi:MAG: hypothetical protein D6696_18455, partial [Acidobacteria bacterium]
ADADEALIRDHFARRDEAEAELLGEARFPGVPRLELASGAVNDAATAAWIAARRPDAVLLYGTGIIRPPLLTDWHGRMVNLHLGLSPYYRGAGTNFWPLVERRPECVGVTLHLAAAKVDAGAILAQARPAARADDGAHQLGTRALIAGAEILPAVLDAYLAGRLRPTAQDLSRGRVFRLRDFNADAVRRLHHQLATGMLGEYLADRRRRDAAYPIVEPPAAG